MALLSSIAGASSEARAGVVRVGVVVTLGVNVDVESRRAIATMTANAVAKHFGVDVIAGNEAERRLPAGGVDDDCVAKPECLKDLGSRLAADQLLMLVVVRVGGALQIDVTWADVKTGRTLSRNAIRIDEGADRAAALAAAAPNLLPEAPSVEPPAPAVTSAPPAPAPPPPSPPVTTASTEPEPARWPIYAAAGVGVALFVGGVAFGLAASSDESALEDDGCETVMCDPARVDAMESKALTADLFYGGAVLSGALAAVLYFTTSGAADVDVAVTDDGARASWRFRF